MHMHVIATQTKLLTMASVSNERKYNNYDETYVLCTHLHNHHNILWPPDLIQICP